MSEELNPYQAPVTDVIGELKHTSFYGPVRSTLGITMMCLLSFLIMFGLNIYSDINHVFNWGTKLDNGFFVGSVINLIVISLFWIRESVRNAWALKTDEYPVTASPDKAALWFFIPVINLKLLVNTWRVTFRSNKTSVILYLWLALYLASLFCFVNRSEVIINFIGMLLAPKLFLASYAAFLYVVFKISREQVKYVGV